jgi:hypothetical protein
MVRTPRSVAAAAVMASMGAGLMLAGTASAAPVTMTAKLSGAAEDPPAQGTGTARVTVNAATGRVCFRITLRGVGTVNAGHIHKGRGGQAGPVFVPLFDQATRRPRGCVRNVQKSAIRAILRNPRGYYVNVHNQQYPAGAARGQLSAATRLRARLSGAAEDPPAQGTGTARLTLDAARGMVCFRITLRGVGTVNAGHIHKGRRGQAGPVFVPLFDQATRRPRGCVRNVRRSAIRAILRNPRGYYVNVHNQQFPAGAARGQLRRA